MTKAMYDTLDNLRNEQYGDTIPADLMDVLNATINSPESDIRYLEHVLNARKVNDSRVELTIVGETWDEKHRVFYIEYDLKNVWEDEEDEEWKYSMVENVYDLSE